MTELDATVRGEGGFGSTGVKAEKRSVEEAVKK
jgi:hypothetical protein